MRDQTVLCAGYKEMQRKEIDVLLLLLSMTLAKGSQYSGKNAGFPLMSAAVAELPSISKGSFLFCYVSVSWHLYSIPPTKEGKANFKKQFLSRQSGSCL